jgi:hypothetical protein
VAEASGAAAKAAEVICEAARGREG